jgi:hypothetical protein
VHAADGDCVAEELLAGFHRDWAEPGAGATGPEPAKNGRGPRVHGSEPSVVKIPAVASRRRVNYAASG